MRKYWKIMVLVRLMSKQMRLYCKLMRLIKFMGYWMT